MGGRLILAALGLFLAALGVLVALALPAAFEHVAGLPGTVQLVALVAVALPALASYAAGVVCVLFAIRSGR